MIARQNAFPKYSFKHVISTVYETSFPEGREGGAFKLLKHPVPSVTSDVLNKLLASASSATSFEIFLKS